MDSIVFIGAVTVAVVAAIKSVFPQITGAVTVVLAGIIGGLLAALAPHLGLDTVTIAAGVMAGLAGSGTHQIAKQVG